METIVLNKKEEINMTTLLLVATAILVAVGIIYNLEKEEL